MFRLKTALFFAIIPTLTIAAVLALGVLLRGIDLSPGWMHRAAYASVAIYAAIVGVMLLRTRKSRGGWGDG